MYLDFDDHRPETPRVASVISVREGVLLSLVVHMAFVIAVLVAPEKFFRADPAEPVLTPQSREPLRFVEVLPMKERLAKPLRLADSSDLDRRAATRERAPTPENPKPVSRGNTPEPVVGGPTARAGQPEPPGPPAPPSPAPAPEVPSKGMAVEAPAAPAKPAGGTLAQSLRNLQQYLKHENFDNPQGGDAEQSTDIQFDSMGVDFGPWLRRFKNQVERNWSPPDVFSYKGRTIIQFYVLRNGFITGLKVVQPSAFPALTNSALNALKLSNPTAALPPDYPADRAFFTVTFHYNEYDGNTP
ncbi:MAG: TonB C-terminal domain-containing protein [Vicinamibacterales bacterium]